MDALFPALIVAGLLFLFLGAGFWLFITFLLVGISALSLVAGMSFERIGAIAAQVMWRSASKWELSAIPLFILMGELIFHTDMARRLFQGLAPWVNRVPGRLLHANVGACTVFSAISGSSVATAATVGKITLGELKTRGYDRNLAMGSLAGSGTFGLMIPPSINMIIYGIIAEVSIAKMFAAGVFPGLLMAAMYTFYIIGVCLYRPSLAPDSRTALASRAAALLDLLPVILLIVLVLGSIYTGLATPTESAVIGVVATLVIIIVTGQFRFDVIRNSILSAVKTSSMVLTLVVAASFMASAMGYVHIPQNISLAIEQANIGPWMLLLLFFTFYLVLGMFMDGVSMMVMSLPIILPLVVMAEFDLIWFGVLVILMTELGQVTPPVGFNLFVIQMVTGENIWRIARAAFPFFLLMVAAGVIMVFFPEIALWLPSRL